MLNCWCERHSDTEAVVGSTTIGSSDSRPQLTLHCGGTPSTRGFRQQQWWAVHQARAHFAHYVEARTIWQATVPWLISMRQAADQVLVRVPSLHSNLETSSGDAQNLLLASVSHGTRETAFTQALQLLAHLCNLSPATYGSGLHPDPR